MPLSIDETARLLAVSPRTVRRLVERGELRTIRIGPTLAVHPDALPPALRHRVGAGQPRALLTLHEAAERLGCAPREVRERTASGELSSVLVGRSPRWSPAEIERTARAEGHA
jgi:excisionase family DNA binding protein